MKQNAAQQLLSVTAVWQSVQFTNGVRKQGEILKERIRQKAGGDEVEMQRLERELDMTEEELDMEASHFAAHRTHEPRAADETCRDD